MTPWTDRRSGWARAKYGEASSRFPPVPEPCSSTDPILIRARIHSLRKDHDKNADTDLHIQLYDRYNIVASKDIYMSCLTILVLIDSHYL